MRVLALSILGIGILTLGTVGCGSDDGPGSSSTDKDYEVIEPTPFQGGGQTAKPKLEYPAGPYGIDMNSIIENYKFVGYANAQVSIDALQPIELGEFYNPTGDGTFGPGSVFGEGAPKPKGLVINVGSVWCPPCNQEAATVLPGEYAHYKPLGGEILFQLADGPTPGTPAKLLHLSSWVTKYKVNYPAVLDPSYRLNELFAENAYPANLMIRTSDMRIVRVVAGIPLASFWADFDKLLAGNL
jgi:hypothetical protein